jgi:AGZA family xanthine/uracil permease-like MFS transporter
MVTMPFTYSITNGIGAGFVSYTVLRLVGGGARDVHWLMLLSSVAFVLYFAIEPLSRLLG